MKLKLLILMVLALTVTACGGVSTAYVEDLEARITALEETVEKHNERFKKVSTTNHCHHSSGMDYIRNNHSHDVC